MVVRVCARARLRQTFRPAGSHPPEDDAHREDDEDDQPGPEATGDGGGRDRAKVHNCPEQQPERICLAPKRIDHPDPSDSVATFVQIGLRSVRDSLARCPTLSEETQ